MVFSLVLLRMYDCEQYYGLRYFIVRLSRALSSAEGLLFYLPYPLASSSLRLEISCTLIAATYLRCLSYLTGCTHAVGLGTELQAKFFSKYFFARLVFNIGGVV